jgi:hypothetical protein
VPNVPRQHPIVTSVAAAGPGGLPATTPSASFVPELVTFVGYVNGSLVSPLTGSEWLLLYREWQLISWLLVEGDGVAQTDTIPDDAVPNRVRDVIWVYPETAVGKGRGAQSDEALFLTGQFTRAVDFDPSETGGPSSPVTGVFCPTTPLCGCGPRSRY